MNAPKKRIPRLAKASLLLGAPAVAACGGGSTGTANNIASEFCEWYARCDPSYFNDYYASRAECTRVTAADINADIDEYARYYGAACASAFRMLIDCYADEYRVLNATNSCGYTDVNCDVEYARFYNNCY